MTLRPLPWRRMGWVVWRQHRLALSGIAVVFGAPAVYLLTTGLSIHHAYHAVISCHPVGSTACQQVAQDFLNDHVHGVLITAGLLQAIPVLVGASLGVPVLARELETGTFRYAWTQGFGRTRWTIAKLITLATAITAIAAAFGVLFSWYYQPISGAGGGDSPPLTATIFDLHGVALPAWTLAAFAIGALTGVLIRRIAPAMFATLAIWIALAVLTGAILRPHYETPLQTTNPNTPAGALVINQERSRGGQPASLDMINQTLHAVDIQAITLSVFKPGPSTPANVGDPIQYLIDHGYQQRTIYQPASRYWPSQLIEGSWLRALSLILITTTVRLVRRRAT